MVVFSKNISIMFKNLYWRYRTYHPEPDWVYEVTKGKYNDYFYIVYMTPKRKRLLKLLIVLLGTSLIVNILFLAYYLSFV